MVSTAKAIPYIYKIIDKLTTAWIDYKISQINIQRISKDNQRTALNKAILRADTNEELIAHSVTLHQLNNGGIVQLKDSPGVL